MRGDNFRQLRCLTWKPHIFVPCRDVSHLDGAHRCQTSWRGTGNRLIVAWRCSLCLADGTTPSAHPLYHCLSHTDINFFQLSRVPHPLDLSCCILLSLSWDDHTSCLGQGFDVRLFVHFIGLLLSQHIYTYARRYNLNVNNLCFKIRIQKHSNLITTAVASTGSEEKHR